MCIRDRVKRLDEVRAPLIALTQSRDFETSLAESAQQWIDSQEALFVKLQGLSESRRVSTSRSNWKLLGKLKAVMAFTNTSGDFLEKISGGVGLISKFIGKGG